MALSKPHSETLSNEYTHHSQIMHNSSAGSVGAIRCNGLERIEWNTRVNLKSLSVPCSVSGILGAFAASCWLRACLADLHREPAADMHVIRGDGTVDGGRRSGCVIAADGGDSMTHRKTRSSDVHWFTLRSELRLHRAALDVAHASYLYLVSWSQRLVLLNHYISSVIHAADVQRGWFRLYAFRHVLPEHTPTRFLFVCCQIYQSLIRSRISCLFK